MLDEAPLAHLATHSLDLPGGVLFTGEAAEDNARRTSSLTALLLDRGSIGVMSIADRTAAWAMLYGHLRKRFAAVAEHFAEHEAIAICACDRTDLVFVTEDKGAALLALGELGRGRVASSFDLWDDLRARGAVDRASFDRLCTQTRVKGNTSLPGIPWRLRV